MSIATRIQGDVIVTGNLTAATMTIPASGIDNESVAAGAGIAATKLEQQHRIPYSQPNAAAASETRVLYRCYGATGTIIGFAAGSIAIAVGAATVTFDLKKNGTTVLSGVVALDSANVARVAEEGTISVPGLVEGDVLELVVVAAAGGGTLPTGVFASITVHEDPQ